MLTETVARVQRACRGAALPAAVLAATLLALPAQAARNALENRYDVTVYANGGKPDLVQEGD